MDYLKRNWLIYLVLLADSLLIPLIGYITADNAPVLLGFALSHYFIVSPIIVFIVSIVYGVRNGFHWWYCLIVFDLFLLSMIILLGVKPREMSFSLIYTSIALAGLLLGWLSYRKKQKSSVSSSQKGK